MDHKIGRIIERYLLGDIVDIILEYIRKCLWEYDILPNHISQYLTIDYNSFDDFLIDKRKKYDPFNEFGEIDSHLTDNMVVVDGITGKYYGFKWHVDYNLQTDDRTGYLEDKPAMLELMSANNTATRHRRIAVSKDDHARIYKHLKQYFDFL